MNEREPLTVDEIVREVEARAASYSDRLRGESIDNTEAVNYLSGRRDALLNVMGWIATRRAAGKAGGDGA